MITASEQENPAFKTDIRVKLFVICSLDATIAIGIIMTGNGSIIAIIKMIDTVFAKLDVIRASLYPAIEPSPITMTPLTTAKNTVLAKTLG